MVRNSFKIGQKIPRAILLCPGPVLLSKKVKQAVLTTNIGHRENEFSEILTQTSTMLAPIIGIDDSYETAFITGSGTAANETVLASIGALGPVLVISNGEFGERLYEVAKLHNDNVDLLSFAWNQGISLGAVAKKLNEKKYFLVAVVHHETSNGTINPISKIAKLAHKNGAVISVDAISSIGAEKIKAKVWGIDILVGASGKALSAMPGVGILVVKSDLLNRLQKASTSVHYLDLYKHFLYMRQHGQTPNTPAVHVFVSLHASLKEITTTGIQNFQNIIKSRADFTRLEVDRIGLKHTYFSGNCSNVITCVELPFYINFTELADRLKQSGIVIYNGKGVFKDVIFQIGHIGALRKSDTGFALKKLEHIIREFESKEILDAPEIDQSTTQVVHVAS